MNRKFTLLASLALSVLLVGCKTTKDAKVEAPIERTPGVTNSAQELTRITNNPIAAFFPAISPDGTKLLYHGRDDSKSGYEQWIIYMKDVNKPGTIPLSSGYTDSPSWDRNGTHYFYRYLKPSKPLVARGRIDGMGINFVSPNAMGESDGHAKHSLNPEEDRILFHTTIGGAYHICTMNSNGLNFTILVEGLYPSWHPTKNMFAYQHRVGKHFHIFTYNLDNGQITQLTSGEYSNEYPSYSPDGRFMVFSSNRDNDGFNIYKTRDDGSGLTQLTSGKTVSSAAPVWSPDGYIYFQSNAGVEKLDKSNLWSHSDIWRLKPVTDK